MKIRNTISFTILFTLVGGAALDAKEPTRQEYLSLLDSSKRKLAVAQRSRNKAADTLNHLNGQLPGVHKAYQDTENIYRAAKVVETQIIQKLKSEIEDDPRPIGVRRWLNETQETERKLREQMLPDIKRSDEYKAKKAGVAELEAKIVAAREHSPVDIEQVAKLAKEMMGTKRAFDEYEHERLTTNFAYREAYEELTKAKQEWGELEREITATIRDNPERMTAGQKAGVTRRDYETRRRAYEDTRRGITRASGRVRGADRAIGRAVRDVHNYERKLGLRE